MLRYGFFLSALVMGSWGWWFGLGVMQCSADFDAETTFCEE